MTFFHFQAAPSPQQGKPGSKLESLPKEELLKFIKKQAASMKDLKKKIDGKILLKICLQNKNNQFILSDIKVLEIITKVYFLLFFGAA